MLFRSEPDVTRLMAEGIRRGRIWTADELLQFMAITDRTPAMVQRLAHAKLEMDGEIVDARRREPIL